MAPNLFFEIESGTLCQISRARKLESAKVERLQLIADTARGLAEGELLCAQAALAGENSVVVIAFSKDNYDSLQPSAAELRGVEDNLFKEFSSRPNLDVSVVEASYYNYGILVSWRPGAVTQFAVTDKTLKRIKRASVAAQKRIARLQLNADFARALEKIEAKLVEEALKGASSVRCHQFDGGFEVDSRRVVSADQLTGLEAKLYAALVKKGLAVQVKLVGSYTSVFDFEVKL